MTALRAGELCAGYGGLALAVEEVFGAHTAWVSEFDEAPSRILAHHWPDVPNYGDMTKIDWAAIEPVDIISGGTPCQDLSHAGRRAGMTEGTRSNLWVQMREAIAVQKPTYVVWENVRGAYSAEASSDLEQCPGCLGDTTDGRTVLRALGRVLGDLSDLGYDTQWRGLRAADVGACHGRFRVFVLAQRRDARNTNLAHVEGRRAAGWSDATPEQGARLDRGADYGPRTLAHTPDAYRLGYQRGWEARDRGLGSSDGRQLAANSGYPAGDWQRPCTEPWEGSEAAAHDAGAAWGRQEQRDLPSITGPATEPRELPGPVVWGDYEPAIRRWEAALGRRAPAPTELTAKGNHRLSATFTEWMMGLPDGWVTAPAIGLTRNEQLKACGNGVVPQQAMAALRDMLAAYQTVGQAA